MANITGPGVLHIPDLGKRTIMAQAYVSPAAIGTLFASKVGLGSAVLNPSGNDLTTNMVEPGWTGYARQAIVWGTPFQIAVGTSEALAGLGTFAVPAAGAGTSIYYWFVVDSALNLIFEYILNAAVGIIGAGTLEVPVVWDWTA